MSGFAFHFWPFGGTLVYITGGIMKKILLTGGSGTIGSGFIDLYKNDYKIYCVGHGEKRLRELITKHNDLPFYLCAVENRESVFALFEKIAPDIVIHAAAIKHIDFADKQPIRASEVNVLGSLNVLAASRHFQVPITIAISTDKASDPHSVYGYTKLLMERCFVEANQNDTRFAVCRFGNVVGSAGSVIPIWREQAAKGLPISITDERMNRFMFSVQDAVGLIHKAIEMCEAGDGGFVLTKLMKVVNVARLAKCISENMNVIGIRPGEQLDECLFNAEEAERAEINDSFVRLGSTKIGKISGRYTTVTAEQMTSEELHKLIG